MIFRKTVFGLAMALLVTGGLAKAEVQSRQMNYEKRYDFSCGFSNNGTSCMAYASIYTHHSLEAPPFGEFESEGPTTQWRSMERLAVFCEGQGLVYANDADSHFRNGELHIVAQGRRRPEIELPLPLSGGSTAAQLELFRGLHLTGTCSYSVHSID
jgi:hypothetical protein